MDVKTRSNGDDTLIAWRATRRIDDCRGFALYRRRNGVEEVVQTWVGFEGDRSRPGERRASTSWPIQKFQWTDYMANPGDRVQYRVVPMVGPNKQSLIPDAQNASEWTPEIRLSPRCENDISCFFNRGIVASQWVQRRLGLGEFRDRQQRLARVIETPGDNLRAFLTGPLGERLVDLLETAKRDRGHVYAALYELNDPELLPLLAAFRKRAHVVLANGSVKKKDEDQNAEARAALDGVVDLHHRFRAPAALAHNKFLVICDKDKNPKAVWTGSTNWTTTGLCTQANNAILIERATVAREYLREWERLREARHAATDDLVDAHSEERPFGSRPKSSLWFTPTAERGDLAEVADVINRADHGVLFLMFNPGPRDSALNAIIAKARVAATRRMHILGAVNQDPSTKKNPVQLFHRGNREWADFDVVLPAAIDERLAYWVKEIKKKDAAFAMVHSKVVVEDPFGDSPVVMTGSHNLGPKASGKNDENLLIIRNAPVLAEAFAVNVMSVYSQYRWRFHRRNQKNAAKRKAKWQGLKDNDVWQDDYFSGLKAREIDFWMSS